MAFPDGPRTGAELEEQQHHVGACQLFQQRGLGRVPAHQERTGDALPGALEPSGVAGVAHEPRDARGPAALGAADGPDVGAPLTQRVERRGADVAGGAHDQDGHAASRPWTNRTTMAPSPTAVAQRLTDPERTSPAA